jgi:zinc/manganese transport system substrate-binding protein
MELAGKLAITSAVAITAVIVVYFTLRPGGSPRTAGKTALGGVIKIVAAENFYGNIAGQLGGNRVSVVSILSDPNVDPHEYESNVQDGIAVADAGIVIENGLQYDTWMDKLLSASPNPNRIVITAGKVAPDLLPGNPHVWYGIDNISAIAKSIADALEKIDPADKSFFENNLASFDHSLASVRQKMSEIRSKYAGTPVALTETIYLYQTRPMRLKVLTPFNFEKAVAEGNDPPAQSISVTNRQVSDRQVKVLIYNSQTVTPITTNLRNAARKNNIPVVPVSETMPQGLSYQAWMLNELDVLEHALSRGADR